MNKKLYNMMDWAAIEEIVYGEAQNPSNLLGAHNKGNNTLIQAYFPDASKVELVIGKETIKMECADEAGYFAQLIPSKDIKKYQYKVTYRNNKNKTFLMDEVYTGKKIMKDSDIESFMKGNLLNADRIFGSHIKTVNGVKGCYFAVYAPEALRVSVIGDFNNRNPKCHQMERITKEGIYELFIPGVDINAEYNYSILIKGNVSLVKCDPYSYKINTDNKTSIVWEHADFSWSDDKWIEKRKTSSKSLNIFEVCLANIFSFDKQYSLRELGIKLCKYIKEMGYSHIELMPVMEYENVMSAGFDACGYFAPSRRYGDPVEYKRFIDLMHKNGIGVILQMPLAGFHASEISPYMFDGSPLYGYDNVKRAVDGKTGRQVFNYAKSEVYDFLASSVNYWVDTYHLDGIKITDTQNMLYLDYYKKPGEWEANINGGNEHLEAIEFIKKINKLIHDKKKDIITIAEDMSGFGPDTILAKDSLGFDYTINYGLHDDSINYISSDPLNRKNIHDLITRFSEHIEDENYINAISHFDVDGDKGGMISKLPGDIKDKFANLKAYLGFLYMIPGQKSTIMGQDIAQFDSFNPTVFQQWDLLAYDTHKAFNHYVKELNAFYNSKTILHNNKNFKWINDKSANSNVISFMRTGKNNNDFLLIVINFANCYYDKYRIGVPYKGKYKQIFNSDMVEFAGNYDDVNAVYSSKLDPIDGYDSHVRFNLAPLSVNVFEFVPYTEAELKEMEKRKKARDKKINDRVKALEVLNKKRADIKSSLSNEYKNQTKEALANYKDKTIYK